GHRDGFRDLLLGLIAQVDIAHIRTHGYQAAQGLFHRDGIASGEEPSEVFQWNAHIRQRGKENLVVFTVKARVADFINNWRQWWDVPNHWQGAVFRVKWQRDFILENQVPDRRLLRCINPGVWDAFALCTFDDLGIIRVQQDGLLCFE